MFKLALLLALSSTFVLVGCGPAPATVVPPVTQPNRTTEVSWTPASPATLNLGSNVTVKFKYVTDQSGGVRIFVRPMTGNDTTLNYGACGSPIYPGPSGEGSCTFTITKAAATVDRLRIQIYNPDQSTLLAEEFQTAQFTFKAP